MSTDELERLVKLKEAGGLTEEEFSARKAQILASPTAPDKMKMSTIKKVVGVVLALWFLVALINAISKNSAALVSLPDCTSETAIETLTQAFNNSPFAQSLHLSVIEVTQAKQLTTSETVTTCSATLTLNSTEIVDVDYQLELRDNGGFMLRFEVKE